MKQILRLFILTAVALAYNASACIDLLWEIPTGTGQIPDFESSRWAISIYTGGRDGSLALNNSVFHDESIYWFDGSGKLVATIDFLALQMPHNNQPRFERLMYVSSTSLIADFTTSWGDAGNGIGMVVFTKTSQGVDHGFFSVDGRWGFLGTDNALIRFEGGKLKRFRFVDDQPVAPANQPVLGSIRTTDRYLLLDYAVAPKQKVLRR